MTITKSAISLFFVKPCGLGLCICCFPDMFGGKRWKKNIYIKNLERGIMGEGRVSDGGEAVGACSFFWFVLFFFLISFSFFFCCFFDCRLNICGLFILRWSQISFSEVFPSSSSPPSSPFMNVQLCFFFNGVPIVDSWFCSRLYRGADEHDRGEGGEAVGRGRGEVTSLRCFTCCKV